MQEASGPIKTSDSSTVTSGPPWYTRCFAYLRNHGRVDPAKVELPHCDFFIVGQRRTLRVLKPPLRGRWFYEANNDRPESVNDNFFSRWSRRPHPSGNCRCSFRQSARLSSTEEQFISAEINRIRNSLCEAERNGQDIEEIERTVAINFDSLIPVVNEPKKSTVGGEEKIVKNKIIQDLERYINDLLQEILTDSVKFVADAEKLGRKKNSITIGKENLKPFENGRVAENIKKDVDAFVDINFAFHGGDRAVARKSTRRKEARKSEESEARVTGYENSGFLGSSNDPDALEFYLNRPVGKNSACCTLEQLDCVDSGINSVETVEFQPDQELSLEESLMEIIDAKLGRTQLRKSWEDFKSPEEKASSKESAGKEEEESKDEIKTDPNDVVPLAEANSEPNFEELRLEFSEKCSNEGRKAPSIDSSSLSNIKEHDEFELPQDDGIELKNSEHRKNLDSELDSCSSGYADSPRDFVLFRKNRKPTIVFLHGFGSSADVFERQLEYFSNLGYPCFAPDMLGHGLSSAPDRARDYHFNKLFNDLDVLLHHYAFRPGQKCVIVAHNYGCSFAAALACKYDTSIHQLVLISGGGPTPLARPSAEGAAHCFLRAVVAPLLVCGLRREVMYSPRGRQHPYCGSEPPEQRPSHMKYVADGMEWPEGEYTLYRRICTPTLLVHGLRDNEVSLVQECQMERTMVKAFLEALPSAGHNPMTDCPDQLNHMIHCFIDLWKNKKW